MSNEELIISVLDKAMAMEFSTRWLVLELARRLENQRPKGEWIEWYPPMHMIMTGEEMLYRCSVCDAKYADVEGYKFCPYCGADMRGTENER